MSMQSKQRKQLVVMTAALVGMSLSISGQQPPAQGTPPPATQAAPPPASATNLGNDANGNPLRRALKTGHVSNYDESKVGTYTLPDPLVLANGKPVRDRQTWLNERRPEILRLYETEIYGRMPAKTPSVKWQVAETDAKARDGAAVMKKLVGTVGGGARRPADQGDAVYAGGGDEARAGHPARELWRRRRAATGSTRPRPGPADRSTRGG